MTGYHISVLRDAMFELRERRREDARPMGDEWNSARNDIERILATGDGQPADHRLTRSSHE